jgi:heme/copper-type cytochrome/quinol oxidase subunit 4
MRAGEVNAVDCKFDNLDSGTGHRFGICSGMAMKILLVVLLALVLVSLFSGLYFMYQDKGKSRRTVIALTIRVALSITIFVIVVAGMFLGWLPGK